MAVRFLIKQQQSKNWYFRWSVPKDLVERFGLTEVKRTTGTTDTRRAQILADKWVTECRELVVEYRGEPAEQFKVRSIIAQERAASPDATPEDIMDLALWTEQEQPLLDELASELGIRPKLKSHIAGWKVWILDSGRAVTTVKTWESFLNTFTKHINTIKDMNSKNLMKASAATGHGQSSQKGTVNAVRSLCRYIEREITHEEIDTSVLRFYMTSDKVDNGPQDKTFSTGDISKVTGYQGDSCLGCFLKLGLFSGRRCVALSNLMTSDVDLAKRTLTIRVDKHLKNGSTEVIPYHPALHDLLTKRVENKTGYLFPEYPVEDTRRRSAYFSRKANTLLRDTMGIEGTFHGFRHTFITTLTNAHVGAEVRQYLTGHSIGKGDHATTYFHGFGAEAVRADLEKLGY